MPITLHQGSLKYKNQQGNFTDIDCIKPTKGTDYWTAADKAEIVQDTVEAMDDHVVRFDDAQ